MPDKFDNIPREIHNNFPGLPRSSRASGPKKIKGKGASQKITRPPGKG